MAEETPPMPPETAEPARAVPAGRVKGFELVFELAAGGMATVFLAHAVDGRVEAPFVAVKRPHRHLVTDKVFLAMLIDEARLASTIDHPNVVKVRELGFEGGEPFVVMDYVEGASLSELRKELASVGRALDPKIAIRIVLDALAGLTAAHEQRDEEGKHLGIIHRDISPHNILLGCDGRSRLTDFGIAKAEDRVQETRTHEVKGKLAYLAPERVDRRRICTVQSDIFSMGVVLWECMAGRRLFRGEEAIETLQEVMNAPVPKLRRLGVQVPPLLDDVIARALSRDLEVRYPTAAEFAQALEKAVRGDVAKHTEVARVLEAVFGTRLAIRHEKIREILHETDVDAILEQSGLPKRPAPTPEMRIANESEIAVLAPLAPSERYSFGNISEEIERQRVNKNRVRVLSGVAGGLVIGLGVTWGIIAASGRANTPPPVVVAPPTAVPTVVPPPEPTVRRVVVPLPFPAATVRLDDESRTFDEAVDLATFELPRESGTTHKLVVLGADGSRAEGFVLEENGVAKPDADGFMTQRPTAPELTSKPTRPRPPSTAKPVGTTRNGFTKLK